MFNNKKGSLETILQETGGIALAAIIALALLSISAIIMFILLGQDSSCPNEAEWDLFTEQLDTVLKTDTPFAELLFFNDKCKLASFSSTQNLLINPNSAKYLDAEKQFICLCQIKEDPHSGEENLCIPEKNRCYELNKNIQLPKEQITTNKLQDYLFITLKNEASKLDISFTALKEGELPKKGTKQVIPRETTSEVGETLANIAVQEWINWDEGNVNECSEEALEYLTDYYLSTNLQEDQWTCEGTAWSASFVSYVANQADLVFPSSFNHAKYFSTLRDNPDDYSCQTKNIDELDSIQKGDILCACRTKKGETTCNNDYRSITPGEANHCDIVTETSDTSLELIGGNLGDTVKKSTLSKEKILADTSNYYGFITCT